MGMAMGISVGMGISVEEELKRGLACHRRGERRAAEAAYRRILDRVPDHAEAWHLLGVIAQQDSDHEAAVARIGRAIEACPDCAVYYVNLGNSLQALGRLDDAIEIFRRAARCDGEMPEVFYNLGNALLESGRAEEALAAFERAVALRADYAEAHNNLGHVQLRRGARDRAIGHFEAALESDPDYVPALVNLCGAVLDAGEVDRALALGRRAVAADPSNPAAHYNLANALAAKADEEAAIEAYHRAIALDEGYADAWCNLGVALIARNRLDEAIAALDRALDLQPDLPDANWNKAIALLACGRYAEGWELYEWRWQAVDWLERPAFPVPEWRGEPLRGRRILVHAEQGFGDTLQFVRCLGDIVARGGRVILLCQAPLKRLLSLLPEAELVIARGEPLPPFDLHLPIMSLPRVLGLDPERVGPAVPYLPRPAPCMPKATARPLSELRAGLVWRGNLEQVRGRRRSCRLEDFEPFLATPGVRFASLQVDPSEDERALLARYGIADLGSSFSDFLDSARAVLDLDLVITIDTAMAHLAGGLGRPVWTLLAYSADWRWLLDREDSPWYPTMRLFRQPAPGDWSAVARRVGTALAELAAARPHDTSDREAGRIEDDRRFR